MAYADVDTLLVAWLRLHLGTDVTVMPELPTDVTPLLPLLVVERYGGTDETITLDEAHVDIDAFAVGRTASKALAEQARTLIRTVLPGHWTGEATVSKTWTIAGPTRRDWDNTSTRRWGASYGLIVHSVP